MASRPKNTAQGVIYGTRQPGRCPGLIDLFHNAGKKTASFYNWEQFRDLVSPVPIIFYGEGIRARNPAVPCFHARSCPNGCGACWIILPAGVDGAKIDLIIANLKRIGLTHQKNDAGSQLHRSFGGDSPLAYSGCRSWYW